MTIIICENELRPEFCPSVQAIYDFCGTHVECINPENSKQELEYFVNQLVNNICQDLENEGVDGLRETLIMMGYLEE